MSKNNEMASWCVLALLIGGGVAAAALSFAPSADIALLAGHSLSFAFWIPLVGGLFAAFAWLGYLKRTAALMLAALLLILVGAYFNLQATPQQSDYWLPIDQPVKIATHTLTFHDEILDAQGAFIGIAVESVGPTNRRVVTIRPNQPLFFDALEILCVGKGVDINSREVYALKAQPAAGWSMIQFGLVILVGGAMVYAWSMLSGASVSRK